MQIVIIPIQDEQQLVEDRDYFVILEQNGTHLVELSCRDDRPRQRRQSVGMAEKGREVIAAKRISHVSGICGETDMESTVSKLRGLHNHLSLVLSEHITEVQFTKLKQHFRLNPFGDGRLGRIKYFLVLWSELETAGIISVQRYDKLENAFESIQASSHNDVIQEFTELMRLEGAKDSGWTHDKITLTKADFDQLRVEYQPLMEKFGPKAGTVHIFENAVFGLIPRSGGELRLKNGTAKLHIPPGAIPKKDQEMFWIFRPSADAEDEEDISHLAFCREKRQSLENFDGVVMYSLPVTLGQPGVAFQGPVLLTLKEYSFPDSTKGLAPLSVYRRTGDKGTWEIVGSCFPDKESRLATVCLSEFSSYVLGMPATSKLLPLNVHIMIQRLTETKEDTSQPCDIQAVFSMNDQTYIQEMVLRKRMNILCETSYYLDPKSDVTIRWEKRNADGSVYSKRTAVLEKARLNRLAEKMQSVTIPIQDEQQLVEDCDSIVILEQNGTNLVELFCRDDRPMKKAEATPKSPRRQPVGRADMEREMIAEKGISHVSGIFAGTDMESTESNIYIYKLRELHNHLSVVLSEHITEVQFTMLKHYFRLNSFGDRKLEKNMGFFKLWNDLETTRIISIQRYDKLEHAFELIQASCHNDVINEFKEKMRYEGKTNNRLFRHDETTLTREEFDLATVEYKTFMEKLGPRFGTVHMFENAVLGLIPRSGGELRLKNGAAKLQIPPGVIHDKDQEMFSIFHHSCDAENEDDRSNLAICHEEAFDDAVKYSLPVTLGPRGIAFQGPVLLTLKEYSFPDSTHSLAPVSVYRRTDDYGMWERVGACFLNKESRSATFSLNKL